MNEEGAGSDAGEKDLAEVAASRAAAPADPAAAPLTSLSSLFGGAIEGTSTCTVDGTCD